MKSFARMACVGMLSAVVLAMPAPGHAACSSGGTVSNVNDCVPGGTGSKDCFVEWSISPVPPPDHNGVPTRKFDCVDNDPACDNDNTPGQCTFLVGACVNVSESRFACTATSADSYKLSKPSLSDVMKPHKNPYNRDNRRGLDLGLDDLIPTGSADSCATQAPFVVPLRSPLKSGIGRIFARVVDSSGSFDTDSLRLRCLPNPNINSLPIASARRITSSSELIGGPLAMGRVGDWLIENDRVRFIIRDVGRDFGFMLTYGGHIMDADLQRNGGPGKDSFLAMTPLINVSSTDNPTSISVVNDGSLGGPAVLQTMGPDDLFDPIDPRVAIKSFSTALSIPPLAIDNNIPVDVVNEYTLAPGDNFVEIQTIISNTGGSPLDLYVGDFMGGGGQREIVAPGLGFGEAQIRIGGNQSFGEQTYDFLALLGFGEAQGITYGLIPQIYDKTSSFMQTGVIVPVYGQNLVSVLLAPDFGKCADLVTPCVQDSDCQPPNTGTDVSPCAPSKPPGLLHVPAGGMNSFTRWFAVTDNAVGGILDARHTLVKRGDIVANLKTGYIQGTVTVAGEPVDGARVVITKEPGARAAQAALVDVFETKDGGFFQGTLPRGDYKAQVKVPGHPYEGGGPVPLQKDVTIGGATTLVDFDVPATGYVRVTATDGVSALPIAAKVSVVGLEVAPDPTIIENASLAFVTGNVFGYDAHEKIVIYGLPQVHFSDPTTGDTGVFAVPPGDYTIFVSHGPEYSVSKTPLTVVAGSATSPQVVSATLVPVVDTTGFISSDYHVHMYNSHDSVVSRRERIVTMLAEGVDFFVASDHDFLTDLTADVAALGASSLVKTAFSDEITYYDSGHFGAWPLSPVVGSVTNGALDWGRAGEPAGKGYPSDLSFDLSVNELALLAKGAPHNAKVVQANHFNSGTLGYFRLSGIDTTVAPPQSNAVPALLRQDPALTNLYSDELTALEIWIENNRSQNALTMGENLGDWFNMLNNFDSTHPKLRKSAVCDSDTHSTTIVQAGGPRNMVASATDDPALIVPGDIADNLNDGRSICTNGPFMRVSITGDLGAQAKHQLGFSEIVPATLGSATIDVNIQSPTWAEFDQVQIYVNNVPSCTTTPPNFVGSTKKLCTATANFTITPSISTVSINGNSRLEANVSQPITVTQDSWVVVLVRGRDGVSKPLFPMAPASMFGKACSGDPCHSCVSNAGCAPFLGTCSVTNLTAADLSDGNLGQCGVTTLAISNPLFIDKTGDGLYKGVAIP